MKKVLFLSLALLVAGVAFADKKCCKKGSKCHKEAKASCNKDAAKADAKASGEEMHACCKKNVAQGKPACCKKGEAKAEEKK